MKPILRKANRAIGLAQRHAGLLLQSFVILLVMRIALYLTHYRRIAEHIFVEHVDIKRCKPAYLVLWAIQHSSRLVPRANCLTRALALQYLLGRNGYPSLIRVGVAQSDEKGFEAHAWVIFEGIAVIGGTDDEIERYTPIADLHARPR